MWPEVVQPWPQLDRPNFRQIDLGMHPIWDSTLCMAFRFVLTLYKTFLKLSHGGNFLMEPCLCSTRGLRDAFRTHWVQWLRHGPCPSKAHLRLLLGDVAALMCLYLSWAYKKTLPVQPLSETVSTELRRGAGNCQRCPARFATPSDLPLLGWRSPATVPWRLLRKAPFGGQDCWDRYTICCPHTGNTHPKADKGCIWLPYDALCLPCLVDALPSLPSNSNLSNCQVPLPGVCFLPFKELFWTSCRLRMLSNCCFWIELVPRLSDMAPCTCLLGEPPANS